MKSLTIGGELGPIAIASQFPILLMTDQGLNSNCTELNFESTEICTLTPETVIKVSDRNSIHRLAACMSVAIVAFIGKEVGKVSLTSAFNGEEVTSLAK